jgi:hypothetical protein
VDPLIAPARVSGSVVTDSPGWGYVNHQSNVIFEENVALNVSGASFVTEDGNEIGQFTRNLSINSLSASADSMHSRRAAHDFGFNGHGFWMQGPGVELVGNIAAGSGLSGFVYYTASAKSQFDAVNLDDPALAGGRKVVPVGLVPIKRFEDNVSIASQIGMEVWFNQLNMNDGRSVIDRFTSWNTIHAGIGLHYSGNVDIRGAKLVGNMDVFTGSGIATNTFAHDVSITNLVAIGFEVGIDVPLRGATTINGATISAVQGVFIEKGHDTVRSVAMVGQFAFSTPNASQSQGRTPWKVYMVESFNFKGAIGRRFESYLSADKIIWSPFGATPQRLYFAEQLRGTIPFSSTSGAGYVPSGYLGKTNYQLWEQYGVAFNGQYLDGTETLIPGIRGYAGSL